MEAIKEYFLSSKPWISIIIIAATFIIWFVLKKSIIALFKRKDVDAKKAPGIGTFLKVLKYLIAIIATIWVLQVNDIDITSIVAGLGLVGVIIGIALQDVLKDLIMGTNIMVGDFFKVGDVVVYNGTEAEVISFNMKVTKLKEINTGNILSVSNRNISEMSVLSDWFKLTAPCPYEIDTQKMRNICLEINENIKSVDNVTDCEFLGTDKFEDSYISYAFKVFCEPINRTAVRRRCLSVIVDIFDKYEISIPYNQLDVHLDK